MKQTHIKTHRRQFLKNSTLLVAGSSVIPMVGHSTSNNLPNSTPENIHVFGPRDGYSPHISILVSMLDWMRDIILIDVDGMTIKDLDYLS